MVIAVRSSLRALLALVVAAALAAPTAPAQAAPEPARPSRGKRPPASKPATTPAPSTDGRAEFERAMALFQAGDYLAAKPLFEQAYALSNRRATTIRALAQCERALGDTPRAIALFREYLATRPAPADTPAIEKTIADLERAAASPVVAAPPGAPRAKGAGASSAPIASATAPGSTSARGASSAAPVGATPELTPEITPALTPAHASPPPAPSPAAPELVTTAAPEPELRWAPVVAVAASALVTAGGATLFILGKSDASSVEHAAPGTPFTDVRDAADRAPALMTAGTVVAGVGVAALAATVVWLLSPE